MQVAVVGTGYVGLVASLCFADAGHEVFCCDSDSSKIDQLKDSKLPFYEPGLSDLFKRSGNRVQFFNSVSEIANKAPVIFVAVGTPEKEDGSADMSFTFKVIEEICQSATSPKSIVLKSTVPIGTAHKVKAHCKEHSQLEMTVINNPEFLRQGAAVEDFLRPDRVVIGTESEEAKELMTTLYKPFLQRDRKIIFMDNISAEMTKYAANSFLALKIGFINELALLADKVGADITSVRDGFASDHRIQPAFFRPGIGYGGSCFPKDVRALEFTGKEKGLDMILLRATDEVNERQKTILASRLKERFQDIKGKRIALWGLSFKPETDDVRRAPSIELIRELASLGAEVVAYDPVASDRAKSVLGDTPFTVATTALEAIKGADALMIVTEWNEFKGVELEQIKSQLKEPVVFDGRNLFDPQTMKSAGFEYYGIGRQA